MQTGTKSLEIARNPFRDQTISGFNRAFFQEFSRNDAGRVDRIDGRSFLITNCRGRGDVLASMSLARQLKERGARSVSLGVLYRPDLSLFQFCPDVDFIFTMGEVWMSQPNARLVWESSDYVINQNDFTYQDGLSFYESRILDACIDLGSVNDFRARIGIDRHTETQIAQCTLRSWGLEPGKYLVFHPQAKHPSRSLTQSAARAVAECGQVKKVVIGLNYFPLQGASDRWVSFAKSNRLIESAALIKHCAGFVGVDSVWHHVAFSFNKPCFVFYSDTRPNQTIAKHHGAIEAHQSPAGIKTGIQVSDLSEFRLWLARNGW